MSKQATFVEGTVRVGRSGLHLSKDVLPERIEVNAAGFDQVLKAVQAHLSKLCLRPKAPAHAVPPALDVTATYIDGHRDLGIKRRVVVHARDWSWSATYQFNEEV